MVYLAGAGPGDPGLLTQRALELMRSCDVVAYDELISDAVLAQVGPDAELLAVGHRGKTSEGARYRIHPDVMTRARAGQRVLRLKCGDPFIFGRGGEEAEELLDAGIPFEVVPGVSSALGAAAYCGIPLTHRLVSSEVTFATGHNLLSRSASPNDWSALGSGTGTLVLFMAARKLRENCDRLMRAGRAATTPAAYVTSATGAGQHTIVGTLADLADRTREVDAHAPALIIVGEVVRLREQLRWIERRPLFGRRVLVARARPGVSELAAGLRALGGEVLEAPTVDVMPLDAHARLDALLARLAGFDALVFGCAAGVEALLRRWGELGRDVRALPKLPLIAIGRQAHERLLVAGLRPAVTVEGACRDAVGAHAGLLRSGRLLLITDEDGRPRLRAELEGIGASLEHAPAYRLRRSYPRVWRQPFDAVVVPSSSAAQAIFGSEHGGGLVHLPVITLGPLAEAAARRLGAQHVVRSERDSVASAITKVQELLELRSTTRATPREARP